MHELPEGFLTSLGKSFLELIFAHVASSRWGLLAVAVDSDCSQVVGYALGAIDTRKLYKEFLLKRGPHASAIILPKLFSLSRLRKAFETLFYPRAKRLGRGKSHSGAELLDIAVNRSYRGVGVAQMLFEEFVGRCRSQGAASFQIPTSANLKRAHRFYEKMGARNVDVIEVHNGERSFVYEYKIEPAERNTIPRG